MCWVLANIDGFYDIGGYNGYNQPIPRFKPTKVIKYGDTTNNGDIIHGCLPKMVFLHNRDIYIMNHDKHVYFLLLLNIGHLSFKNSMKN